MASRAVGALLSGNPQVPRELKSKKQKYIANSSTPMMSLKDLQGRYKYSAIKN